MDGVLTINKPAGMTSHDVVLSVRRILKEKKIGHTGTLDPMATGVLVLCIGKATRIARYLEAGEKEYSAVMRLGVTTDTLDAEGRILETVSYASPAPSDILRIMQGFTGVIMQRPPVFSALKVNGVPSYKLAREGKAEPLQERSVTISRLELTSYVDPLVSFNVTCSKGTYIRTLSADIGAALGMGAHLTALVRTRSGRFSLDQARNLDVLSDPGHAGAAAQALTPIDAALGDFPVVQVGEADAIRIRNGNRIPSKEQGGIAEGALVRIHDPAHGLLAVAVMTGGNLAPEVVFPG